MPNDPPGTRARMRARLRANRNLLLFLSIILLIVLLPVFRHGRSGEIAFVGVNILIIATSALSNGAWRTLYWISFCVAVPAISLASYGVATQDRWVETPGWMLAAAVHLLTIVRLLNEIFEASAITRDRLFACANVYLLIGVAWCYLYALLEHFAPGSLQGFTTTAPLHASDTVYFSFNVATNVALTDVLPTNDYAKSFVLLQELASVLYMAFVISRLVGLYAPTARDAPGR